MSKALQAIVGQLDAVLLPDTSTHRLRMEIKSESSDNVYVVSQRLMKNGAAQFECGCKGWIFKRNCKHLKAMTPVLEQAAALLDSGKLSNELPAAPKAARKTPAAKAAKATSVQVEATPVKQIAQASSSTMTSEILQSNMSDKTKLALIAMLNKAA